MALLRGLVELLERRDERLGDEPAAELAEADPDGGGCRGARARPAAAVDAMAPAVTGRGGAAGVAAGDEGLPTRTASAPCAAYGRRPRAADARTRHAHDDVSGMQRGEPGEGVGVDVEGLEVAGVDADDARAGVDGAAASSLVVHLDQRGHARATRARSLHADQGVLLQGRHDEQDQVGAVGPGLPAPGSR